MSLHSSPGPIERNNSFSWDLLAHYCHGTGIWPAFGLPCLSLCWWRSPVTLANRVRSAQFPAPKSQDQCALANTNQLHSLPSQLCTASEQPISGQHHWDTILPKTKTPSHQSRNGRTSLCIPEFKKPWRRTKKCCSGFQLIFLKITWWETVRKVIDEAGNLVKRKSVLRSRSWRT